MTNDVDTAILARLAEPPALPFEVHDGWFPARPAAATIPVVVDIPMPYLNYMSSFGDDDERRLSGRTSQREKFFRLFVVGISREQVVGAIGLARNRLEGHRLAVAGKRMSLIVVDSSPMIFRDDGAVRPDGKPLFTGIDNYTVRLPIQRVA